jgi:hypothetical protein
MRAGDTELCVARSASKGVFDSFASKKILWLWLSVSQSIVLFIKLVTYVTVAEVYCMPEGFCLLADSCYCIMPIFSSGGIHLFM